MSSSTWILVIAATFLVFGNVECSGGKKLSKFFLGRSREGFLRTSVLSKSPFEEKADQDPIWFTQKLDHFNTSDTRTFKQRYFYNGKFYKEGGPAILMIGGEEAENGNWAFIETLAYMEWARNFSAAIFDLEHRFYGKTQPFPEQTTENLKYLSSRQAIEDIADFMKAMNKEYNFTNPRWITYGGSYSGAMALWFRELHPELTIGAVGSSGPMLAELDFHEYLEDIEEALATVPGCFEAVADGTSQIRSLIWTEEGRNQLSDIFNLKPRFNETKLRHKDLQNFFSLVADGLMGAIQYSNINGETEYSLPNVCAIMTNQSYASNVERLAAVFFYMEFTDETDNDYDGMIDYLKITNYDDLDQAAARSWIWQTCTEFGYYQTSDYGKGIFGGIALNYYVDMCTDTYGAEYVVEAIQESVHSSNGFYGGRDNFKATNAVLLYGSIDPWHKLGHYKNSDPSVVIYLINGTAHCADMYETKANDKPGLAIARKIAYDNVQKWITGTSTNAAVKVEKDSVEVPTGRQLKPFTSTIRILSLSEADKAKARQGRKRTLGPNTPYMVMGRPFHGLVADPPEWKAVTRADPPGFVRATITQPIDQFDSSNTATYEQRYWINPQYYVEGGPQFLFIEGENTAREKWLTTEVTFMQAVKKYSAMAFMLEHRFYGHSYPPNKDMSSGTMKYLTTKQALADINRFITAMNQNMSFTNPRWVTFGGSYPGSLSAWFRQEYPEATVGAIASSAGPEIKVDFFEYLIVVEQSIRKYSNPCGDNVKTAFSNMHQYSLTGAGRAKLSDIFKLSPAWTATTKVSSTDVQFFFQDVYDKFQGTVQYNKDNREGSINGGNIEDVCRIMENSTLGDEVQRVAEVYKYVVNFHGGNFTTIDNSYDNYVKFVQKDDYSDEDATDARGWMYACCTEIGYLQTTDIGDNAFGSVTPVDFWLNFCEDVFGKDYVPARKIYDTVGAAQKYHRGRDGYNATNVVFVSGKIDPWHKMGPLKSRETDTMKIFYLEETAHCADMYPARQEDPQELVDVRQQIFDNIGKWVGPLPTAATGTQPPSTGTPSTGTQPPSTGTQPPSTMGSSRCGSYWAVTATLLFAALKLFA